MDQIETQSRSALASPQRAEEVVDSSLRARLFAARGPFKHARKKTREEIRDEHRTR
ncbi:MAG: hypothetical protein RL591_997, partial [Planctomycetota bacterium]